MTYSMFLDDERFPATDMDPTGPWVICRSAEEAENYFDRHGCPSFISFDHDLGSRNGFTLPTGHFVALDIVSRDLDSEGKFIPDGFDFFVHSQNPVGAENIRSLMNGYLKSRTNSIIRIT